MGRAQHPRSDRTQIHVSGMSEVSGKARRGRVDPLPLVSGFVGGLPRRSLSSHPSVQRNPNTVIQPQWEHNGLEAVVPLIVANRRKERGKGRKGKLSDLEKMSSGDMY